MKPIHLQTITLTLALALGARACLQVHTHLLSDPFSDDGMTIQIFEGSDRQVCMGGGSKFFSSNQDWFQVDCPDTGYRAAVTENGKRGWVENYRAGYRADLVVKDSGNHRYCCAGDDGGRCRGYCSEWESCLNDNHQSCGGVVCKNCDFRGSCSHLRGY
ncbi:hypothetical protein B0T25DRAFT_570184 [Lasiosphaeria hispida]|uniref:Uncharacterized protein n=1 Tax=Lasiosphaeria hispida TaxID=260671 RepID=A0AAJ0HFB9_9PEZI|nr:hypothetical protein B0T25DRAFT_570184 [Lasiosphaeria hispida]